MRDSIPWLSPSTLGSSVLGIHEAPRAYSGVSCEIAFPTKTESLLRWYHDVPGTSASVSTVSAPSMLKVPPPKKLCPVAVYVHLRGLSSERRAASVVACVVVMRYLVHSTNCCWLRSE